MLRAAPRGPHLLQPLRLALRQPLALQPPPAHALPLESSLLLSLPSLSLLQCRLLVPFLLVCLRVPCLLCRWPLPPCQAQLHRPLELLGSVLLSQR